MVNPRRLAGWRVFQGVARPEVEALLRAGRRVEHQIGDVVYREGEPSDGTALLVLSGRFAATLERGGRSRLLSRVGPGEVIGEVGLLDPTASRSSTVTALQVATCLHMDASLLDALADNAAMIAIEQQMISGLARRIGATTVAIRRVWREEELAASSGAAPAPQSLRDRLSSVFGR